MENTFFYDESGQIRKITAKTYCSDNFDRYYIGVSIRISEENLENAEKDFLNFENKYSQGQKELKSSVLGKGPKYNLLLKNLNNNTLQLIDNFLDIIINNNIEVVINLTNKTEILVKKLFIFPDFLNLFFINNKRFYYSLTKILENYFPKTFFETIDNVDSNKIKDSLSKFLLEIKEKDLNLEHKTKEVYIIDELLYLSDFCVSLKEKECFSYEHIFNELKLHAYSKNIENFKVVIDKEEKTYQDCKKIIEDSYQEDSRNSFQIRICDFIAGLLLRLLRGIISFYKVDSHLFKKMPIDFFNIDNNIFNIYKKLHYIVCANAFNHQVSHSLYCDDFLILKAFLDKINSFESYEKYNKAINDKDNKFEENFYFYTLKNLEEYFKSFNNYLNFEYVNPLESKIINNKGGKINLLAKTPKKMIPKKGIILDVLSVGIKYKTNESVITIKENNEVKVYSVPNYYNYIFLNLIALANSGIKFFPTKVLLKKNDDKTYDFIFLDNNLKYINYIIGCERRVPRRPTDDTTADSQTDRRDL